VGQIKLTKPIIYQIAEGVNVMLSKDGTWETAIKYQGFRNRRRFGKDLDKAVQYAELMVAKLGIVPKTEGSGRIFTVGKAAEDWRASGKSKWADSTKERYNSLFRDFVMPSFGRKPLEKVDRGMVKDLLVGILAIRAPKTVELVHAVISGIFSEAIDRRIVTENPYHKLLSKILPPKRKRNEAVPDPLTKDDLEKVLETSRKVLAPTVALVIETMAHAGMRLGECLAMHIDHLDASNFQYMVSQTERNGKFSIPKSGKRLIDLTEDNTKDLEAHILRLRKDALSEGKEAGYLFLPKITQRIVQRALQRACRAAKVRTRTPHDLRHTYATILLMDHYSPAYIQKQLGHHSISMTVDIYGHWIPGEGKKDLGKTFKPKRTSDAVPNPDAGGRWSQSWDTSEG